MKINTTLVHKMETVDLQKGQRAKLRRQLLWLQPWIVLLRACKDKKSQITLVSHAKLLRDFVVLALQRTSI